MAKSLEFINLLADQSWIYLQECIGNTKEMLNNKGGTTEVRDRHIPTIDYFLRIWMPLNNKETIVRSTYYAWLDSEDKFKSNTIKNIDDEFKSLATDIVANEGKGIFYAKNRLGMTDRQQVDTNHNINLLNIDPLNDTADHSITENSSPKEED